MQSIYPSYKRNNTTHIKSNSVCKHHTRTYNNDKTEHTEQNMGCHFSAGSAAWPQALSNIGSSTKTPKTLPRVDDASQS